MTFLKKLTIHSSLKCSVFPKNSTEICAVKKGKFLSTRSRDGVLGSGQGRHFDGCSRQTRGNWMRLCTVSRADVSSWATPCYFIASDLKACLVVSTNFRRFRHLQTFQINLLNGKFGCRLVGGIWWARIQSMILSEENQNETRKLIYGIWNHVQQIRWISWFWKSDLLKGRHEFPENAGKSARDLKGI